MNADLLEQTAAAIGNDEAILDRIMIPGTHLALWRRTRPARLGWVDEIAWNAINDLDFPAPIAALETEIAEGLTEAGYPQDDEVGTLREEISALARRFAALMGCDWIRLRLEVVETDACRKFHADVVTARLLTTLSGPATQWVEAAVPDRIHQLATGDVAIFKGRLLAEEPAILHRSPPIAGTGDKRLLLAIDPYDPAREVTHV
ncbi:DUF1826 domain-containing protein [Altererythrobacter sp. N1]|nr:DUF1826 domain-containing protein [Altererythrobacter sp. N1]